MIYNQVVQKEIESVYENAPFDWKEFGSKTIFITGANGLIGSFLIACLSYADRKQHLGLKIVASVRDSDKAKKTFANIEAEHLEIVQHNILSPLNYDGDIDYLVHGACPTKSNWFVEHPIETFLTAVEGTRNVLDFALCKKAKNMVFLSSMEVYGQIETLQISEEEYGYMDLLQVRSSYPMGKRAAETLCSLYANQHNLPVKIARLAQTFGASASIEDTRVFAQFARSVVHHSDIVLRTTGETIQNFCALSDAVRAILLLLLYNDKDIVYNIANTSAAHSIMYVAKKLAEMYDVKVVVSPGNTGMYRPVSKWRMSASKIEQIGWKPCLNLDKMFRNLIESFKLQEK